MPYITEEDRRKVATTGPTSAGELNYLLSQIIDKYASTPSLNYQRCNDVIGVLECLKAEFYRRVVAPYENEKLATNGEVFHNARKVL